MPTKEQVLEREARWARPVVLLTIAAVVLFLGSLIVEGAADLIDTENDATKLVSYDEHSGALLATAVARAIGSLLLAAPLFYLFAAAQARSDPERARRRRSLGAFAFIGPACLAVESVVAWIGFNDVAGQFVDRAAGAQNADLAGNLIDDSGAVDAATALFIPVILGLLIGLIFISLISVRAGLLRRFAGTMGMALGAALPLLGPPLLIVILVWFLYVGLMIGGWLPSGRPPAWAAGEAIPWPTRERGTGLFGTSAPKEPGVVEGTGQEIDAGTPVDDSAADGSGAAEPDALPPAEAPAETQGQRRKKRKRRR